MESNILVERHPHVLKFWCIDIDGIHIANADYEKLIDTHQTATELHRIVEEAYNAGKRARSIEISRLVEVK